MNYRYVTSVMNIGREKSHISCRKISFYSNGIPVLKRDMGDSAPVVYGNVPGCDKELSFHDIVRAVGVDNFNDMERLRASHHWPGVQGELTWYAPLQWTKLWLLAKELEDDKSLEAVYWIDSGIPTHGFFSAAPLASHKIVEGFHVSLSPMRGGGWHGLNMHRLFDGIDRRVQGGLFGGTRQDVLSVGQKAFEFLRWCLSKGVVPLDEDFLSYHYLSPLPCYIAHAGFGEWIKAHV